MDLLGSILGSMEKPPTVGDAEKKKAREQKERLEKQNEREKQKLNQFRERMQKEIHAFIKDSSKEKHQFKPMDKVLRAIVHEVADVAGLTSFSFGHEEIDRYVMLWKKEFAPTDDELLAYRRGEEWDPAKAKELAKQRELDAQLDANQLKRKHNEPALSSNYRDKYKHLIGEEAAKDAAKSTKANKSYGFVPSDNKKDQRTIEQVLADSRAKKKLKTESGEIEVGQSLQEEGASNDPDQS